MKESILQAMNDAERKAWEALSGYKFWMFGYHAARWINYNQLLPDKDRFPNPFRECVHLARKKIDHQEENFPSLFSDAKEAIS